MAQDIIASDFVPLSAFGAYPVREDVVYADPSHPDNHFGELYGRRAGIWMHKEIAAVTLLAAEKLFEARGWTLKVNDCLRSFEAQEKMATKGFDPSLVSTPGSGAHPRGMAIDVEPIDDQGRRVDMGTRFDHFTTDMNDNPAARNYTRFGSFRRTAGIRKNREDLTTALLWSAMELDHKLLPLPQEWWDFRFREEDWGRYAPAREAELPGYMRQVSPTGDIDLDPHLPAIREIRERVRAVTVRDRALAHAEGAGCRRGSSKRSSGLVHE